MGFLDSLLGRTKLPKSNEDRLFAMSTAAIGLEAAGNMKPAGRSGIVFKRLPPGRFDQIVADTQHLLELQGQDSGVKAEKYSDQLGFDWMVMTGGSVDFQDSIAAIHSVAQGLIEEGLGDLLLACAFRFDQDGQTVYFIYSYKTATFYPFVPTSARERNNSEELRIAAIAKAELPVEPSLERWYALWGLPV